MCGLVAIVPKYNSRGLLNHELDAFESLVTLDTLRGKDSTGIFGANKGTLLGLKDTLTGSEILKTKEYQDFRKTMFKDGMFVVAHNRAATRGVVNDRNAHPFTKDNKVVMVHNGTFIGDHKKHADTEVDSEALCHLLADHDPDKVDEVLQKINAAYALIWYDTRDNSLNFIRNDQRPLYVLETNSAYIFSSEALMLSFVSIRERLTMEKDAKPVMIPEHEHWKMTFNQHQTKLEKTQIKLSFRETDWDEYAEAWSRYQGRHFSESPALPVPNAANCAHVPMQQQQQQQPGRYQSARESRPLNGTSLADKIVEDSGHVTMLSYDQFPSYREMYKDGSSVDFFANNIIPLTGTSQGKYILYGQSELDEEVIVACEVDETDFNKLIKLKDKKQRLRGKVQYTVFKNLMSSGKIEDMAGAVIVNLRNVENVTEENICGC